MLDGPSRPCQLPEEAHASRWDVSLVPSAGLRVLRARVRRFGWVGDTSGGFADYQKPGRANCMSCLLLSSASAPPSGDAHVDGMLSTLAHEIAETATDPWCGGATPDDSGFWDKNWVDLNDNEVGDFCAWVMGSHRYDAAGHVRLQHSLLPLVHGEVCTVKKGGICFTESNAT
jgi:Phosphate-induced protein 1 conserved region